MAALQPWLERPWPDAVPRFATPRNYDRDTLGPELVEISRKLGYEPMPWQCDLWDVQYELDSDGTLWYREFRITVPRQSAKTTSTLVRHVDRHVSGERRGWGKRQKCLFTMQNASDARDKIIDDWFPVLQDSEWTEPDDYKLHRSNGREGFTWANGANTKTFPPNAKGGHGKSLDLVDIDEAFAFADGRVEQGARPAMITRPSPQIVIQSTMGTSESTYLNAKVEDGRRRVESGEESHVGYVEYSIDPERDDINNPDHWHRWMPALGYTISHKAVLLERDAMGDDEKGRAEFMRAYGNALTVTTSAIIPLDQWRAIAREKKDGRYPTWISVDVSPGIGSEGRSASIAIARFYDDETVTVVSESGDIAVVVPVFVEVIKHGPGTSWVAEELGRLTRAHTFWGLYVDPAGAVREILPDIRKVAMAKITELDARGMAAACGRFHQAVHDGTVYHRNQEMLNAAVAGADKRTLEDAWAWKRRTSSADISPLVAATLAHWAACSEGQRGRISMHTG